MSKTNENPLVKSKKPNESSDPSIEVIADEDTSGVHTSNEDKSSSVSADSVDKSTDERPIRLKSIIKLLIPITISLVLVLMYVRFICENDCSRNQGQHPALPFVESKIHSKGDKAIASVLNASVFILIIIIMTFLLLISFWLKCYKVLYCFLMTTTVLMIVILTTVSLGQISKRFNIAIDRITAFLFVYNYSALGLICIFWIGPSILQKSYLIINSVLIAIQLMRFLPEWTSWALLVLLVIWDLIAVLCPFGPLKLLITTYKQRQAKDKKLSLPPGLLYTTMLWTVIADSVMAIKKDKETNEIEMKSNESFETQNSDKSTDSEDKYRNPQLGLGDFIFYGLLIGKVAIYDDFNLVVGCYIGIIVGLGLTLILLIAWKQALPALPISITIAIILFILIKLFVSPFVNRLNANLIYI